MNSVFILLFKKEGLQGNKKQKIKKMGLLSKIREKFFEG